MKFFFLASFIVLLVWLAYEISKSNRRDAAPEKDFWARERRANNTRRKPLDDLEYIKIPFDRLPVQVLADDEQVREYLQILYSLDDSPIVNLTGLSNTDLKLAYGAPNIDLLTRYDQNYTILARTLQLWANCLYERGYTHEARDILEFAVSTRTDVSGSYKLLCRIYREEQTPEKIQELVPIAESLQSAMKGVILRVLEEEPEDEDAALLQDFDGQ